MSSFCPYCKQPVEHWEDWNVRYRNVVCPRCGSHPRHRLLVVYLEQIAASLAGASVLHFAPEKRLANLLRAAAREYVTTDLHPGTAYGDDPHDFLEKTVDVVGDIIALGFPDERFDVIVCSHVLEHVEDDTRALAEIYRMLRPGGWALLQTPFDKTRATTLQSASIKTPAQRLKFYLHEEHVRLYGRDIFQRFSEAGFMPAIIPPALLCKDPVAFGLDEDLMIVRKEPPRPRYGIEPRPAERPA